MHQQEKDEATFGQLHQRRIAPAQEAFEARFALDCKPERQEMQRQEYRERKAGEAMHQRCDPQHARAVRHSRHQSTTATTARSPSNNRHKPRMVANIPEWRALSRDHSTSTLWTPIGAWIATATTKAP